MELQKILNKHLKILTRIFKNNFSKHTIEYIIF